jgi:hypothetical protein
MGIPFFYRVFVYIDYTIPPLIKLPPDAFQTCKRPEGGARKKAGKKILPFDQ